MWKYSLVQARAREWCSLPPLIRGMFPLGDDPDASRTKSELQCLHSFVESKVCSAVLHPMAGAALSASLTGEVQVRFA